MGKAEYIGSIKSFNVRKGWGFIECPETQQIYGKDILFQRSELPSHVEKGDRLSFSITQGRNGVLAVGLQLVDRAVHQKIEPPSGRDMDRIWEQDSRVPPSNVGFGMGSFTGVIKSYNPQKGWGFVESQETQEIYGKDILFLKEELRGAQVSQGQHVAFSVSQGRKGPLATSLRLIATGAGTVVDDGVLQARPVLGTKRKWQDMQDSRSPSFLGTIKSFNLTRGWGFVECEETQQIYGKDILVLKDEVAGVSVTVGQRVSFRVTQGRNGPLATDIQILVPAGPSQRRGSVSGTGLPALPATSGPGRSSVVRSPGPLKVPEGQEHICGIIKSFDEQKGWGFITGEAILQLYGKDIYLSRNELRGQMVSPGDQVMFAVEMGMKGPMASGVAVLPGGSFVTEGTSGTIYAGLVKSFNAEKGWGFVTSEETMQIFGKDLFLHKRELGDGAHPNAGDQVQFTVQLSTGGRPEAASVYPLPQ